MRRPRGWAGLAVALALLLAGVGWWRGELARRDGKVVTEVVDEEPRP